MSGRNYLMRPIGRGPGNPLLPGTHRRLSGLNVFQGSNTYIQNNFFGGTPSYGNYWNSFGGYGCGYGCGGGSSNKFMNWMTGLGFVSMFAGLMTNLFTPRTPSQNISSTSGSNFAPPSDETDDETDASKITDLTEKQNELDKKAEGLGLKAGDIQAVQDANGKIYYIYNGKKYNDIDAIEAEINKAGRRGSSNTKAGETENRQREIKGSDWVNNHYSKPGDIPPAAKDDPKLIAQMKKTGIMPPNSTPEDIINNFVNKELEKMGYNLLDNEAKAKLKEEIIKHNPSIYNQKDGTVIKDADYKKLEVPGMDYILKNYKPEKKTLQTNQLGLDLVEQIKGFSLNKNTNKLLEQINKDNVVDVLTTYQAKSKDNESLIIAISEEEFIATEINPDPIINSLIESGKLNEQEQRQLKNLNENFKKNPIAYKETIDKFINTKLGLSK